MALQLRASRPILNNKLIGAVVAVIALLLQPFGAFPLPVVSALNLPVDPVAHSIDGGATAISRVDTSARTNLMLSFSYDVNALENGANDKIEYGWIDSNDIPIKISEISGQTNTGGNDNPAERGSRTHALPAEAQRSSLAVYFKNNGTTNDTVNISGISVSGDIAQGVTPQLIAQDFATWDNSPNFKGFNVGFAAHDFGTVTGVTVDVLRADDTHVIKTAGPEMLALLSDKTSATQASASFVVLPGDSDGLSGSNWWSGQTNLPWTASTKPVSVTVTVTGENGTEQVTNETFLEGDSSAHPAYASMLPAPVVEPTPTPTAPATTGTTIFDAVPNPFVSALPSLGYAATQTHALGDKVSFATDARDLNQAQVVLTSWACETGTWSARNCVTTPGASFTHPITLNLYEVASDGGVGNLIDSKTQTFDIPYRPTANPDCNEGRWKDTSGGCFNGINHAVTFDMSGVTVPETVIYSVAYNTQNYGANPVGVAGPYDSLNFALNTASVAVSTGSDVNSDEIYWDQKSTGLVADNGWAGLVPAVKFTADPPAPIDSTGPTVSEVSPSNGSYENSDFIASVDATDESGVKKIALYVIDTETGLKVKEYAMTAPVTGDTWKANVKLADIGGDGQYDLRFRAVDTLNNVTYLNNRGGSFVIDVDSSKPSDLSLKLADGRDVQGASVNGTQTFVFTQSEANPQRIYIEYMEKDSSGVWRKKVGKEVLSDNRAELVVDTRSFADGLHQVKVSTRDEAGNASGMTAQFTVDNGTPTVTVKDGYSGDKNQAIFSSMSFKLYDKYYVDKLTLNGVAKNLTDSQWSDLNGVKPGAFGAVEGVNELVVFDVSGNQTTYEFVLDTKLPTASIQNPIDGEALEGTVPVTITAKDETKLAAYSYRIKDIATGTVKVVEEVVTDGSAADAQTVFSWNTKAFDNGEYYVYVSARDAAGNRSEERFNVTVANSGPAVTVLSPVANQAVDESVDVSFSATDPAELGAYCVKLNGGSCVPNGYRYQPNGSQVYTVVVDTSALTEGEHTVTVRVTDRVGNVTEADTIILVQREGDEPDDGGSVFIPPVLDGENPPVIDTETGDQESTGGSSNTTGGTTSGASNNSFTPTQQVAALPNFIAAVNNGVGISSNQVADNATQDTAPSEAGILGTSTTESESDGDVAGASDEAGWSIADMAWYLWVVAVLGAIGVWLLLAAGIRRIRGTNV